LFSQLLLCLRVLLRWKNVVFVFVWGLTPDNLVVKLYLYSIIMKLVLRLLRLTSGIAIARGLLSEKSGVKGKRKHLRDEQR
jgi:hypothetical protein